MYRIFELRRLSAVFPPETSILKKVSFYSSVPIALFTHISAIFSQSLSDCTVLFAILAKPYLDQLSSVPPPSPPFLIIITDDKSFKNHFIHYFLNINS